MDYSKKVKRAKGSFGRMDIMIDDSENEFVMIIEIKATDWDKIRSENIRRNLSRHGRQLHKYVNKYIKENNFTVGLGIIYPNPPKTKGLKEHIEHMAMELFSFPVYWYTEIMSQKLTS